MISFHFTPKSAASGSTPVFVLGSFTMLPIWAQLTMRSQNIWPLTTFSQTAVNVSPAMVSKPILKVTSRKGVGCGVGEVTGPLTI